jgi:predicted Zn-dependent protease
MSLGKPEQAKPVIDELVKQDPANLVALDAQFHVAAATKDYTTAKAAADAMVATQPKAGIGYYYQGVVAETEKRSEDAVRLYSQSLDLQPEAADALSGITRALVGLNRVPEALKRLDEVSARFPKFPVALDIKGEVLLATHHVADAIAAFKSSIEREPKWWSPYRHLAQAQRADNDLTAAAATLQAGIAQVDQPQGLQVELADLLERMHKPDEAIAVYEDALRRDPHADLIANNLAMLLITYKKNPASIDRAKQLSERFSHSSNASFLDTYGWVLYKRGEAVAAVAALQTAVDKTPDSAVPLYHLGMAQASAGQSDAAVESLSRSLKSGKSFTGMDEAKATLDKLAKPTPVAAVPRS